MTKKKGTIEVYDESGNKIDIYPKVETDTTLTKSNVAADGYIVGAKFKELSEKLDEDKSTLQEVDQNLLSKINDTNATITQLEALIDKKISAINSKIYPIGSIYISVSDTNPKDIFGGTWEQIEDTFLLSAGSKYAAGSTGGEATHTLTTGEMPNHAHSQNIEVYGYSGWGSFTTSGYGVMIDYSSSNYHGPNKTVNAANVTMYSDTGSNGNNQAHNNMPPYLAVYVWKRTA